MADYHVHSCHRHVSTSSEDFEDESLDPRIQIELEKLNKASEEINRLELELDDARASFRQTLSESTQKLDVLAKKLGSCVEKARPYYDARVKAKDAHIETQRAALRFERACSMHEAAKEMVQLAEQGYMRRELPSDPAWQEMLNHATMKVNEAEKERNESELEHQRTMNKFKVAEDQVQMLQKELKRAINKSKPYFEMKARFNQVMEEHKCKVSVLEEDVSSAKSLYSTALRSLEAISDEIHRQRLERRQHQQLGVRGSGVGAECPLPPPSWEKGMSIDGRDSRFSACLDPLGVVKVPVGIFGTSRRSRNLSGESYHGEDISEDAECVKDLARRTSPPETAVSPGSKEPGFSSQDIGVKETEVTGKAGRVEGEPLSPKEILIPGDPLGVLPPMYTSKRSLGGISHPAFAGNVTGASHTRQSAPVAHPSHSHPSASLSSQGKPSLAQQSISAGNQQEQFVSPSVVRRNPDSARRQSYRRAVEASQREPEEFDLPDKVDLDNSGSDEVYADVPAGKVKEMFGSVYEARQRSYSNPADVKAPQSPSKAIPGKPIPPAVQDALADGRRHGSAPERSESMTSNPGPEGGTSPSLGRQKHKLQGLILRIDPSMDPLYNFEPRPRSQTGPVTAHVSSTTDPSASLKIVTPVTSPPPQIPDIETEPVTPTPGSTSTPPSQQGRDNGRRMMQVSPTAPPSKPIMRSASTVSSTLSERSETEYSEIESVSAAQSPTRGPRTRLLNIPAGVESHSVEDSSDTESLASTGPMLDDEQVEFLTMDFSHLNLERDRGEEVGQYASASLPANLKRGNWSRMSLPPKLSYLEDFLNQAKRLSDEFHPRTSSQDDNFEDSPMDGDRTIQDDAVDELQEGDDAEAVEISSRKSHSVGSQGEEKRSATPRCQDELRELENKSENQSLEELVEEANQQEVETAAPVMRGKEGNEFDQIEQADDDSIFVASETIDIRL